MKRILLTKIQLAYNNYPIFSEKTNDENGNVIVTAQFANPQNRFFYIISENKQRTCSQCKSKFNISDKTVCFFHPYKAVYHWHRCSNGPRGSPPCRESKNHCSEEIDLSVEGKNYLISEECFNSSFAILIVDCKFNNTLHGKTLGGLAIIDYLGNKVYEKNFKNFNEKTRILFHEDLKNILGPNVILVGHALNNDLLKMRVIHSKVVDTSVLYPHPKGESIKYKLDDLVRTHLKEEPHHSQRGSKSLRDVHYTLRLMRRWLDPSTVKSPCCVEMTSHKKSLHLMCGV